MSKTNYTLDIISHHSKSHNKTLRKYQVDGIDTVGAFGDEEFSIVFKNNTPLKVQVKLSIDGTDIFTGELADTQPSKEMWVVNGYGTLNLKAWVESNQGGAAFVFTSGTNSVAKHVHGDMSNRGIIAAAVFTEGHVEPIKLSPVEHHHHHHYDCYPWVYPSYPITPNQPIWQVQYTAYNSNNAGIYKNMQSTSNNSGNLNSSVSNSCYYSNDSFSEVNDSVSLESLVAVGAGQYTQQNISYVTGLIKPMFTKTVRVRYLWWDELVAKLRTQTVAQPQPSGFPGDKKSGIDLKGTPRVGSFRRAEVQQQVSFDRF